MKQKVFLLLTVISLLLLSGCRSSRHAVRDADTGATPSVPSNPSITTPTVTPDGSGTDSEGSKKDKKGKKKSGRNEDNTGTGPLVSHPTNVDALSAKLNLQLEMGSKRLNVGGTYRLKYDDVIQLNLTYTMIFTVNVGTLELTHDYILLLDRINKRYCKVSYSEVPSLAQAGIDFNYLQRVFWGEAETSPSKVLEWTYGNWTPLGDGKFPQQMKFSLHAGTSPYVATFHLSNLQSNSDWATRTEVPSKYTAVSFESVLNALLSAAK